MTAPLVAAGAVAKTFLNDNGVRIAAYSSSIGRVVDNRHRDLAGASASSMYRTRAADADLDAEMEREIRAAGDDGDSVGGTIGCIVEGIPLGTGGMWFDALDVSVARMMFSIPAVKGVEFGKGFALVV